MNLNNFHKHVSHTIYKRGEEYYENDMIDNVGQDYPDTWTAEIEGSELYAVEVKLDGEEIVSWNCDCPYDQGNICKHIVAFFLYIKDNKGDYPVNIEIPHSPQQEQLTEILKHVSYKELTFFLSRYADTHPDFYQALLSNLHPQKKGNVQVDYAKEIQKCFHVNSSYDRYDYSHEGEIISGNLDSYIEKAKSLIKLNCTEEALTILLHIIKEIGDNYEEYDDYNGDLACVCQEASEIISEMIKSDLPDNLLKVITDEIGRMIKNSNYDNYDLANLNQLLFSISLKTSNFEDGIRIINEALKNEPDSFRTYSLVISKIELLENAGKKEEVKKVISHYLYLPEIRKIKLKELISEEQYEKAIALIDEGISLAEKKNHPGTVSDWKDEKLSVYKLTDNKEKVIELAEYLFVNGRESMKYYHILKSVIPSGKWAGYLDNFLLKSEKQKMWRIGGHILAQIYILEEYWDRLMTYVEKNIRLDKYCSLREYESYLKPRYPERMLAFYRSQIIDYADKNMGRDHYKYVADILKVMKDYPGGSEIADTLLAHFKSVYSRRRAMMEELEGI
ncbi:MAG: SWIM zinc finger family protein [Tannerellaceae bacterium]|jgi:tetratricopeptide (TPR) repeat protein|nr:SWIM zinc finger family protein [Tannerellaceae bacterium]